MSLGLKKDTVRLEPHQAEWDAEGERICKKIRGILGDDAVDVQHLYRCGDLEHDIVTHFIHVVIADSEAYHDYIDFRDYLNSHEEDAREYEQLKIYLCSQYPSDREAYSEGKKELIDQVLAKIREFHLRSV